MKPLALGRGRKKNGRQIGGHAGPVRDPLAGQAIPGLDGLRFGARGRARRTGQEQTRERQNDRHRDRRNACGFHARILAVPAQPRQSRRGCKRQNLVHPLLVYLQWPCLYWDATQDAHEIHFPLPVRLGLVPRFRRSRRGRIPPLGRRCRRRHRRTAHPARRLKTSWADIGNTSAISVSTPLPAKSKRPSPKPKPPTASKSSSSKCPDGRSPSGFRTA